jgi:putative inorganic carbon (HCO3(-)) transporter
MNIFRQKRLSAQLSTGIFGMMLLETFFLALWPLGAEIALLIGIALWLLRLRTDHSIRRFRHLPFDIPVGIFFVLGAASILVSPDPAFSFYNYYNLAGVYLLTYLLFGQNVRHEDEVRKIVLALAASAACVVGYGFYQYVFGIDTSAMNWVDGEAFPELKKRVFSTWQNPNILAGYLDVVICLAFGIWLKTKEHVLRLAIPLGMLCLLACLAMTYARGACLALAAVFVGYGILRDWRILVGCIVLAVLVFFFDAGLMQRLTSVFTQVDTSMEMREAFWESTVAMIQDHPFLGIGWGAYFMAYPEYDFYLQGAPVLIVHAHNLYLNYAAEIGIAGALAFICYLWGTMAMALRAELKDMDGFMPGLMLGIGLAIASIALNGLTDDVLFNIPSSLLLWLLGALAAAVKNMDSFPHRIF